jgi:hypothetical protein
LRRVKRSASPLRGLQGECESPTPRSREKTFVVLRRVVVVDNYELPEQWIEPDPWSWIY